MPPFRSKHVPRTPDEYAVFLLMTSGHREEVRFLTLEEFQKWYASQFKPKANSDEFMNVPIQNIDGEYMVVRPSAVMGIRVEPVFGGSVERF